MNQSVLQSGVAEGRPTIRGRGTAANPPNRFEPVVYERDPDAPEEEQPGPRTQFLKDHAGSIITYNDSPDLGFEASLNPYRGCEHGCIYCYARPYHEYLGFSTGLDFETKILVKENAPELLRRELASPRWRPQGLALSGVTDPYQPVERRLRITRRCLEVLAECRNPVSVVTKNPLVTRDRDFLAELARFQAASVCISITTLDSKLASVMEPRTATPASRLEAIAGLTQAGIPAGALVSPVIPGLNDHEMPSILAAAGRAGAAFAGFTVVRLPGAVSRLFQQWLEEHFPARKEKVLAGIRSLRGGELDDARFGFRMHGAGPLADQLQAFFEVSRRKAGIPEERAPLSTAAFRRPAGGQLQLFD